MQFIKDKIRRSGFRCAFFVFPETFSFFILTVVNKFYTFFTQETTQGNKKFPAVNMIYENFVETNKF